jgi:hypothetical protein
LKFFIFMRLLLVFACLITAFTPTPVPKSQPMTNVASSISSPEVQSLKNDIHALENSLQQSRKRQDWWNGWYLRLGVAALVLATFLGIASWVCQKKASSIEFASRPTVDELTTKNGSLREVLDQAAKVEVAQAQTVASDASTRAGKAEERAANAQASLASAEQHSAEANAKAEGFRLDIAKANESAQQAEARAAQANLELARFKAPRTLSPIQQAAIAARLRAFVPQTVDIIIIGDSPEITNITNLIGTAMQMGGWTPKFVGKAISGPNVSGVLIGTLVGATPDAVGAAEDLITSLGAEGLATTRAVQQYTDELPMAIMGNWDSKNVAPIRMIVSAKP